MEFVKIRKKKNAKSGNRTRACKEFLNYFGINNFSRKVETKIWRTF